MTSTTTPTLAARIAEAMSKAGEVTKSETNKDQGYKFASAEQILKAVRGPLLAAGVILVPSVTTINEVDIESSRGTRGTRVIVGMKFTFTDGNDSIEMPWQGEGQDYGDKAYGKAYTNAVKTFIRSAWLLPTEHDDPEASPSGERAGQGLPAWARALEDAEKGPFVATLATIVGGEDQAKELARAWAKACGGSVPFVVSAVIDVLAAQLHPGAPADEQEHVVEGGEQQTLGEAA